MNILSHVKILEIRIGLKCSNYWSREMKGIEEDLNN
jgi:hypothetical protein